jgi:ubiquinone/menaquinone biosynthesis C-methylase UbiE
MEYLRKVLDSFSISTKILDVGCGEGALVQEYHAKGYEIQGVDPNYESSLVQRGDATALDFRDESFEVVLCLDVLEHLSFQQQEQALAEMSRVLSKGGTLIITVPNLAHLASRLSFILLGKLIRTSGIDRHPGDRPVSEYLELLRKHFSIEKRIGFFPTFPLISLLTRWRPSWSVLLHRVYNRLLAIPSWCFLNLILAAKPSNGR